MSDLRIVGMGFVGIPLALAFDDAGHNVVGYDIDTDRIQKLRANRDPTDEVTSSALVQSDVTFTSNPDALTNFEYTIITVPTPINKWSKPDLSAVEAAAQTVGKRLTEGGTVILESTVYPGATAEVLIPTLEETSGLSLDEDFAVGYSPERLAPGPTDDSRLRETSKLVSATDDETLNDLVSLYESIIDASIYPTPSIETAEASKCLENVQRDVNIAIINEFVVGCRELDIDLNPWAVLEAARTKPAFHDYRPGVVGGHCIPVDPHFLVERFARDGFHSTVIEAARRRNASFPENLAKFIVKNIEKPKPSATVGGAQKLTSDTDTSTGRYTDTPTELQRPRALILGFAYKANINDSRNHALARLVKELKSYGVSVAGHDPIIGDERLAHEFDVESVPSPDFERYDAIVITTLHDEFQEYNLDKFNSAGEPPYVLDLTGYFGEPTTKPMAKTDVS